MEQSLRNQYLKTLGIASWLPRRQLPGARPTPDWVWEYCWPESGEAAVGTDSPHSAPILNPADRARAAKQARAELSASFGAEAAKPAVPSSVPLPAPVSPIIAPTTAPTTAPISAPVKPRLPVVDPVTASSRPTAPLSEAASEDSSVDEVSSVQTPQRPFKLAFMLYQDCLVIDSLPPVSAAARASLNSGQADAHHQILLDKILRSLGLSGGSAREYHTLPWPMFASKSLDQGAEQARLTVQHKLKKSLQKSPVATVLLLGEAAAQMVLEREEPLEQLRGMLFSLRSDVKTLASASLTEMMMLPGCKRDVWSDLQPLLNHLHTRVGDE
ncbi:hypothetical protein EH243_04940 [Amphritea opalescens]|uniref:Uracil-DNA glycosylase-like domain-containing protein n=1 Tax=Amphritea opalescens TaxID=2490544 RepID=A0A430KTZ6_9GAMM|nr:hypothetical protein [Amphritea opalescens]RTE66946.1 hypothetical protein EH243_04940 [Amphritea opalescens]